MVAGLGLPWACAGHQSSERPPTKLVQVRQPAPHNVSSVVFISLIIKLYQQAPNSSFTFENTLLVAAWLAAWLVGLLAGWLVG
jgi:hypothetical protein